MTLTVRAVVRTIVAGATGATMLLGGAAVAAADPAPNCIPAAGAVFAAALASPPATHANPQVQGCVNASGVSACTNFKVPNVNAVANAIPNISVPNINVPHVNVPRVLHGNL